MSAFIRLAVTAGNFIFSINLYRRITYLRGDNGIGKSTLVWYIENKPELVSCSKTIKVLKGLVTWEEFYNDTGNTLFIMDDTLISGRVGFSNSIIQRCIENDSYLLVINSIESTENATYGEENFIGGIDCSAKEIYIMKNIHI